MSIDKIQEKVKKKKAQIEFKLINTEKKVQGRNRFP